MRFPERHTVLRMVPFRFSLGIGCRNWSSRGEIGKAVNVVLERYGISMDAVAVVASADAWKAQEKGLFDFVEKYRKELRFFTAEQFRTPVPVPNLEARDGASRSLFRRSRFALLGAGRAELCLRRRPY
ncbi:MAG: cobalamin biosynthesis protein [Victivallales bacterium]